MRGKSVATAREKKFEIAGNLSGAGDH